MAGLSTPVSLTTYADHNFMPDAVPQPFARAGRQPHLCEQAREGASYPGLEIIAQPLRWTSPAGISASTEHC